MKRRRRFAMRTRRGFAEILELFRSCADCVRGRFAQTALRSGFTTAIFAEGISTHPRAWTVTPSHLILLRLRDFNSPPRVDGNLIASPCSTPSSDFNSPPRGDKDFRIPRRGFFFPCLYFLSLCCIMFSQAVYLSDNEEEPHGNGALCVILSRRYDGPDFR